MESIEALRRERDELQEEKDALLSLVTSQQMEIIKLKATAKRNLALTPPNTPPILPYIPEAAAVPIVDRRLSITDDQDTYIAPVIDKRRLMILEHDQVKPSKRRTASSVSSTASTVDSRLSMNDDRGISPDIAPIIENRRSIVLEHDQVKPVKPAKPAKKKAASSVASLMKKKPPKKKCGESSASVKRDIKKLVESSVNGANVIEPKKRAPKRQKLEEEAVVEECGVSYSAILPTILIDIAPPKIIDQCTDTGIFHY
jgi:hypothetical protein